MKSIWKSLKCYLFHNPIHNPFFRDMVSGAMVSRYHCNKCDSHFMAVSRWSIFRVKID